MNTDVKNCTVAYLSGAPRVTTSEVGESGGARSHVLGIIGAYRDLGWGVKSYIYGDTINVENRSGAIAKSVLQGSFFGRAVSDFARIYLGWRNSKRALDQIGSNVSYVYERYAIFQSLGRSFKSLGVPWILETQGLFYYEAKFDRQSIAFSTLAKRFELDAYRDADVIVAVSQVLRDLLVSEAGVDPRKIVVVPNGVDINRFAPIERVREISRDRPTLGFVGGLLRWQGLDILLKAIASTRAADFNLEIVGDGEEKSNLEAQVAELGLKEKVKFIGRVPGNEVAKYIRDFDICFSGQIASKLGGMYHSPLKIYEYMACGKPVIASDFADARSVIQGKDTGYLFDPGNVEALARVLDEAFLNRHRWQAQGVRARAEIVAGHSWSARGRQMIDSIANVINQRN